MPWLFKAVALRHPYRNRASARLVVTLLYYHCYYYDYYHNYYYDY